MDQTSPHLRDDITSSRPSGALLRRLYGQLPLGAIMAKFYVQSGNLQMVLQAKDCRSAAIWAAHRTLSQSLPFLCDDAEEYLALADLTKLGETVRVSQRGFAGSDYVEFQTLDVLQEWNRLLVALDRLQARLQQDSGEPVAAT